MAMELRMCAVWKDSRKKRSSHHSFLFSMRQLQGLYPFAKSNYFSHKSKVSSGSVIVKAQDS